MRNPGRNAVWTGLAWAALIRGRAAWHGTAPAPLISVKGDARLTRRGALGLAAAWLAAGAARADGLGKADRVVVLKAERRLELRRAGELVKSYAIALGPHPKGPKRRLGDGRTPEGLYRISGRTARTPFHRLLYISYPNEADRSAAAAEGVSPGGEIGIHGMPNRYGPHDPTRFYVDWTDGCIAVGNLAIEEIWAAVDDGTPIEIRASAAQPVR